MTTRITSRGGGIQVGFRDKQIVLLVTPNEGRVTSIVVPLSIQNAEDLGWALIECANSLKEDS